MEFYRGKKRERNKLVTTTYITNKNTIYNLANISVYNFHINYCIKYSKMKLISKNISYSTNDHVMDSITSHLSWTKWNLSTE